MAGKASKAAHAEPCATTSEPPSTDTTELSSDHVDVALKAENGETAGDNDGATSPQRGTTDSTAAKSTTEGVQDDAASRGSSESDDKAALSSPSKKSGGRSKKGGRSSRGKSSSSKRSSEEHDAAKDDAAADASEQVTHPPSSTDTINEAKGTAAVGTEGSTTEATEAEAHSSSAADAEATAGSSDIIQPKSASTSKELAQLGLGSFGDGAEDDVVGPRRSRRGPGASPDPKARVPKTEPDSDSTSLQDVTTTNDEAAPSDDTAKAAKDSKNENEHQTAPEEVASEPNTGAKLEVEDDEESALTTDPAHEMQQSDAPNDEDVEEGEADDADADADEQDGELDGDEAGDEGVTRCVCGSADENVGLMIQCETCKCWQHCVCMGMQVEEDCPDVYFCEQCRPELHIPLLRSLGLLPKASKKGTGKNAKYSTRELKEAKEAIAMLAQENARRQQAAEAAASYNSRDRKGSHNSRIDPPKEVPKSPKRRSTMNSRDSAYGGWEPIPPGLLADGEVWEGADDRKGGKKRKRGAHDDHADSAAETPEIGEGVADAASDASKRRRMSAGAGDQDGDAEMDDDELSGGADHTVSASRDKSSKKKKGNNQYTVREASVAADPSSSKPRHPNQYTYRSKDRNGAAAVPNGQKTGSSSTSNLTSHSPSPSPSKGRAEHARRAAARDTGSQIGTPAPGESGVTSRGGHQSSSVQLSLPEHLTHLAYLLPQAGAYRNGSAADNGFANGSAAKKGSGSSSGQSSSVPSPPASSLFPTPFQVLLVDRIVDQDPLPKSSHDNGRDAEARTQHWRVCDAEPD